MMTRDKTRGKPYLYQWGEINGVDVWVVDGDWVRTHRDIEFTNYDQHYHSPDLIPEGEIWLDYGADETELKFFAKSAAREYRMMANGATYAHAEAVADATEAAARKHDPARLEDVRVQLLAQVGVLEVWLVRGRVVRDLYDIDFTEGGHDRVYPFIPKNQIWLDDATQAADRPFDFLHELNEWLRMGTGEKYPPAHRASSRAELYARLHPDHLRSMLRDRMAKVPAVDDQENVTVWIHPYVVGDEEVGTYGVDEAADLLGYETKELIDALKSDGSVQSNGYHAEFAAPGTPVGERLKRVEKKETQ